MSNTYRVMSATKRSVNPGFTTAQAEDLTTAGGWSLGTAVTAVPGTVRGPFGYGNSTDVSLGGAGTVTHILSPVGVFTKGANTMSFFFRPGTTTTFSLNVFDTTTGGNHTVTYTLVSGVWTVSGVANGALGRVLPDVYPNGWMRVEATIWPGRTGAGATVAGNGRRFRINSTLSTSWQLWGAHITEGLFLETTGDSVTKEFNIPSDVTDASHVRVVVNLVEQTAFTVDMARRKAILTTAPGVVPVVILTYRPQAPVGSPLALANAGPYLSGLGDGQNLQAPLVLNLQRIKDENGMAQIQMLNTPSAEVAIQGRSEPGAPWYTITLVDQTLLVSDTYALLISLFSDVQVVLTQLNNDTTTVDVWITE